ncbi:major histocompatibility complex class I-related gene protein isoform X1 [Puntigrus tetrazona]|uniref:major histocompatibility complex class I-related gene protein isoform X1 n=1 Tax=Puntigrus tetrazona TaxID=1606681 RepID=UPI001C8AB0F2|nr:major histocompatibility complex class I-related gene protein isoform X1 [Puntigrus tetrazona]
MLYLILVYILSATHIVYSESGSHSLWVFATFLTGDGSVPFSEFTAVVMLDDIVIGRYNADERSFVPETVQESVNITEQMTISTVCKGIHEGMKTKAYYLIDHLNCTRGLHVQQRLVGCELLRDEPGRMMTLEAFNGESGFERRYSVQGDQHTDWKWPVIKSRAQLEYDAWLYAHFYRPLCISQLRKYLKKEQKRVMAKVRPRVRVIKRLRVETGIVQMVCLATGFYPRHINLTLLQDGQPVNEERIAGGELLPNPDGTYQMRKSVELSAEEQRERHTYTCTVTHLSLDNKLDISIEPGPDPVIVVPSVLLLLCVFGCLAAFKIWRRFSPAEQIIYAPASAADEQTIEQQQT